MVCDGWPLVEAGMITPPPGKVAEVYIIPLMVTEVALVGKALILMAETIPGEGSVLFEILVKELEGISHRFGSARVNDRVVCRCPQLAVALFQS